MAAEADQPQTLKKLDSIDEEVFSMHAVPTHEPVIRPNLAKPTERVKSTNIYGPSLGLKVEAATIACDIVKLQ